MVRAAKGGTELGFFDELKTWARGDDEDEELEEMTARPSRNNKPTEPDNEFAEQGNHRHRTP